MSAGALLWLWYMDNETKTTIRRRGNGSSRMEQGVYIHLDEAVYNGID